MVVDKHSSLKNSSIAVVYLARMAEGIKPLQNFADTYLKNPAGIEHDFVVVYKGYNRVSSLNKAKQVFAEIRHIAIEVSDKGYDINAYVKAARSLNHDYICFVNTFTEILAPDWLVYLYKHIISPRVGIAGAMGSYESLYDSAALIQKVIWLCNGAKISYNKIMDYYYSFAINAHCKSWRAGKLGLFARIGIKVRYLFSLARKIFTALKRRQLRDIGARIRVILVRWKLERGKKKPVDSTFQKRSIDDQYKLLWEFRTGPEGDLTVYSKFPSFPNPHIRTNCFVIARELFLDLTGLDIKTKLDAFLFESGIESMTNQILRLDLKAIVVACSGQGFNLDEWFRSGTFRQGNQQNLLLTDNQSRHFDAMSSGMKATYERITWGDYLAPSPSDFPDFGFKFAINDCPQHD